MKAKFFALFLIHVNYQFEVLMFLVLLIFENEMFSLFVQHCIRQEFTFETIQQLRFKYVKAINCEMLNLVDYF